MAQRQLTVQLITMSALSLILSGSPVRSEGNFDIILDYTEGSNKVVASYDVWSIRELDQPLDMQQAFRTQPAISKELLIKAGLAVNEIAEKYGTRLRKTGITFHEIQSIYSDGDLKFLKLIGPDIAASTSSLVAQGIVSDDLIMAVDPISGMQANYDPISILAATHYGAIDIAHVFNANATGKEIEYVKIDAEMGQNLSIANYWMRAGTEYENRPSRSDAFAGALELVRAYDETQLAMMEKAGKIDFGEPVVWTAEERHLELPKSISENYAVKWIEFPVNVEISNGQVVREIYVEISVPSGSRALELAPHVEAVEVSEQRKTAIPEISVQTPVGAISIGEIFGRTVGVKFLRPTVIASGLGKRTFSWTISGEAVRRGAHRFVAVLAFPKEKSETSLTPSGHFLLSSSIADKIAGFGEVAGTSLIPISISY